MRDVVKLRRVAGSTVVTIPVPVLHDLCWPETARVVLHSYRGKLTIELDAEGVSLPTDPTWIIDSTVRRGIFKEAASVNSSGSENGGEDL